VNDAALEAPALAPRAEEVTDAAAVSVAAEVPAWAEAAGVPPPTGVVDCPLI
jgi:hypothetical protein